MYAQVIEDKYKHMSVCEKLCALGSGQVQLPALKSRMGKYKRISENLEHITASDVLMSTNNLNETFN